MYPRYGSPHIPDFESGAFNRSATSPHCVTIYQNAGRLARKTCNIGLEPEQLAIVQEFDAVGRSAFRHLFKHSEILVHPGVSKVGKVEGEGFGGHGELGRAVLVGAVVAEDAVLDVDDQAGFKFGDFGACKEDVAADDDVANELALVGSFKVEIP